MTPFKKAVDAWTESEPYKVASEPRTLKAPSDQRQYLENRLRRAFDAGWDAGYDAAKAEFAVNGPAEGK